MANRVARIHHEVATATPCHPTLPPLPRPHTTDHPFGMYSQALVQFPSTHHSSVFGTGKVQFVVSLAFCALWMCWWVFHSFFWASSVSVASLLLWKPAYILFWVSGVVLWGGDPSQGPTFYGSVGDKEDGSLDVEGPC